MVVFLEAALLAGEMLLFLVDLGNELVDWGDVGLLHGGLCGVSDVVIISARGGFGVLEVTDGV